MTRINVVPPQELTNKHLIAEYRELPRIFGASKKWHERGGDPDDLPTTYRLGKGHVLFFYDKLRFLSKRHRLLVDECLDRGFNVQFRANNDHIRWAPRRLLRDYAPTPDALRINRERIAQRIESASQRRTQRASDV